MAYQPPNIMYQPHRGPQTWFHKAGAQVVCFGGARGGGKSMALLMEATRRANNPEYKALIVRRTYPQLAELIGRAHRYLPKLGFTWRGTERQYVHPSGGYIKFMSFQHEKDVENVVGHEYHWLGIDQVEQFTQYMVEVLESCVRSSVPGLRTYMRYTSNPGSIGHLWVKERFVDVCRPVPYGEPIHMKQYNITWQPVKPGAIYADKSGRTHQFIPSRVFDNPSLFVNDPQYVRNLQAMPEKLRMAHLFGDYDVFEGQFFSNWNHDVHVIEPFEIPVGWQLYGGYDYGRTAPACYLLAAVDWDDNVYIIREYYKADASIEEQAAAIRAIEAPFIARGFREPPRVADPSIWAKIPKDLINPTYPTDDTIEMMFRDKRNKINFIKANNNRKIGWAALREGLDFESRPSKTPRLRIFGAYCPNLVRTLPAMVIDSNDVEDIDTTTEDHACFAAGTKVKTINGNKNIEALKVGDLVLTRAGFKPVVAVAMTSDNAEVFEYSFSNGAKLQCTSDHPVFSGGEFKKISSLTLCDTITILEKREFLTKTAEYAKCQRENLKSFFSTVLNSEDTQIRNVQQIGIISNQAGILSSAALNRYIEKFGKTKTVIFQLVMMFIIKMAIIQTIALKILNWYAVESISHFILKHFIPMRNIAEEPKNILPKFALWPRLGIKAKMGANGIESTPRNIFSESRFILKKLVIIAASRLMGYSNPVFAPIIAKAHGEEKAGLTMSRQVAHGAIKASVETSIQTSSIAQDRVHLNTHEVRKISDKFVGMLPVYNITVDEQHEFYANGVLVKNCDTARYLWLAATKPERPKPQSKQTWREKHLRPQTTDGGVIRWA